MNIKNLKLMIFMLILLTFPTFINADACSDAKKDAANVKLSYEFFYDEDDVGYFKIKVNNVKNNITVYTDYGEPITNGEYDVMALDTTQKIVFPVYSNNDQCNEPIYEISLKLPLYNNYSDYKICEGIEDFKYCKQLIDEDILPEQIREKIIAYRDVVAENRNLKKYENIDDALVLSDENKENKNSLILISVLIFLAVILCIIIVIYLKRKKVES